MTTTIGNSTEICRIGDSATPGSGTYQWYLPPSYRFAWPDPDVDGTQIDGQGGIQVGSKGFILNMQYIFDGVPILTYTNHANLRKALFYWSKNTSLLYLTIKPDGYATNNIAVAATFAAPETLIGFTGRIYDYVESEQKSNNVKISFRFPYRSS